MTPGPLGRRAPTDWQHVDRYPLTTIPATPVPIAIGINWYANFDDPVRDPTGHYWIGRGPLGQVRGGHCVCLKPRGVTDLTAWWDFYDQGPRARASGSAARG
jgi:hypothetical protein